MFEYYAYAKINVTLDILSKREDGYHEMEMIMQRISLFDTLQFTKNDSDKITITSDTYLCEEKDNLCYKATKKLFDLKGKNYGVNIHIIKGIPHEAGLGGGSADCATTLIAINEIFDLGFSFSELVEVGATLGSDVPYCMYFDTMLVKGVGDKLQKIQDHPKAYVLIAKPKQSLSTGLIFKNLDFNNIKERPNTDLVIKCMEENDLAKLGKNLVNVMETVSIPLCEDIKLLKEDMIKCGSVGSLMAGSGSTVFGYFDDEQKLNNAYDYLNANYDLQTLNKCSVINRCDI